MRMRRMVIKLVSYKLKNTLNAFAKMFENIFLAKKPR